MVAEALSDITDKVVLSVLLNISASLSSGAEDVTTIVTPATGKRIVVVEIAILPKSLHVLGKHV